MASKTNEKQHSGWLQFIQHWWTANNEDEPTSNDTENHGASETAWADTSFFQQQSLNYPDAFLQRWGMNIYKEMLTDDQIQALLSLKQASIASRSWHFVVKTPEQQPVADFFTDVLDSHLRGSFRQSLIEMMSSQVYGFSLLEKIYEPFQWENKTHWGLKRLKLRPANTFRFQTDKYGNLIKILQHQGSSQQPLKPERFIHHVNHPEQHPWYGESDLKACYRHWWAKGHILRFWNVYLERMAAGFVHGKISGPLSNTERDELKDVMRNLSKRTSVITPNSVDLKMITAPSTDAFEKAVAARDKAIAKALLVPNLLGLSEQGSTGSYSQSKTQLETFFMICNGIADSIADTLNEQLFRELCQWNFDVKSPPMFVFDPLTQTQKHEMAKQWLTALKEEAVQNSPRDEAKLRTLLGFPPTST